MESIKMMHLGIRKGDVGKYVFLPGSPERSEKISRYLDNPVKVAYNREFLTFTGTLEGVPVSVTSTGIGGPSTAIAVEELYQCGADTMIRIGTCASVSPDFHKGDLIIPNGAVRREGTGSHYLPLEFPAVPDFETARKIEAAAIRLNYRYKVGVTITKAGFFTQTRPETKPVGSALIQKMGGLPRRRGDRNQHGMRPVIYRGREPWNPDRRGPCQRDERCRLFRRY